MIKHYNLFILFLRLNFMRNEITTELSDIEKQKIILAYNSKLQLHIKKKNEEWLNGYVKDIQADFFYFEDRVNGIVPIFWLELLKVEPYMEVGENGRN